MRANFQWYIENFIADLVWLFSAARAEQVLDKWKELRARVIEKRCMRWWKPVNSHFNFDLRTEHVHNNYSQGNCIMPVIYFVMLFYIYRMNIQNRMSENRMPALENTTVL